MTVTRKWSLMATLLVVAIFVASWFLLIAPRRSHAADLRSQAAAQDAANSRLQQKIAQLQAQALDLPRQQARLAAVKVKIPENPALPALIRDLSAAAKKSGVSLEALAPSKPIAVVNGLVAPTAGAAATGAGTTASGTPAGSTTTTAAAPPAPLFQVPVKVDATGSYFEIEQFLNKIEDLKRAFLVTGLTIGEVKSQSTPGSTSTGDLSVSVTGRVFLSPPTAAVTSPTTVPTPAPAAK